MFTYECKKQVADHPNQEARERLIDCRARRDEGGVARACVQAYVKRFDAEKENQHTKNIVSGISHPHLVGGSFPDVLVHNAHCRRLQAKMRGVGEWSRWEVRLLCAREGASSSNVLSSVFSEPSQRPNTLQRVQVSNNGDMSLSGTSS